MESLFQERNAVQSRWEWYRLLTRPRTKTPTYTYIPPPHMMILRFRCWEEAMRAELNFRTKEIIQSIQAR